MTLDQLSNNRDDSVQERSSSSSSSNRDDSVQERALLMITSRRERPLSRLNDERVFDELVLA